MSKVIKVIDKALNIIEILARNPSREVSLTDIAGELNMDKGTCSLIIKNLLARGYIQQSAPRSGYKFGYMFYKLTDNYVNNENLTLIANDDILTLSEKLNERAFLTIIKNDKRVFLMTTAANREQSQRTNIDKSAYVSSAGRVIIANFSPEHLQKFISRVGLPKEEEWPEVYISKSPAKELANRLSEIKMAGYEILIGNDGNVGVASPLFRKGHVVGSIMTLLPKERMNKSILPTVLETAKSINDKIASQEEEFDYCTETGRMVQPR